MTAVLATELKQNFKVYAGLAASGEVVKIKRPKKEDDLILMSEREYNQYKRVLMYFALANGYKDVDELVEMNLRNNEEETLGNDEEFMSLFGCLKDEPLEIPEDKPAKVDEWKEWF